MARDGIDAWSRGVQPGFGEHPRNHPGPQDRLGWSEKPRRQGMGSKHGGNLWVFVYLPYLIYLSWGWTWTNRVLWILICSQSCCRKHWSGNCFQGVNLQETSWNFLTFIGKSSLFFLRFSDFPIVVLFFGVSVNGGSPKMLGLVHGKSIYKRMRTGGTPHFTKAPYLATFQGGYPRWRCHWRGHPNGPPPSDSCTEVPCFPEKIRWRSLDNLEKHGNDRKLQELMISYDTTYITNWICFFIALIQ